MFLKLRELVFLLFFLRSYSLMPNIGDVRLFNVQRSSKSTTYRGEAQMFLTDGSSPAMWSSICKSNSFDIDAATLFCKQLNYSYGNVLTSEEKPAAPFLISEINCQKGKKYRNLLECSYSLGNISCSYGVFLQCNERTSSNPRDGQLEICPPDPSGPTNAIASVSFGVIGIHFRNHWRAIGNQTISQGASNLADLMCMSMGFQRAVIGSLRKAESVDQHIFSDCKQRYESHSWINITSMVQNCDLERQYPCLECCLTYPTHPSCSEPTCADDFIVIQCTIDLFEKKKKITYQDDCTFAENSVEGQRIQNYGSVCTTKFENIGETILGLLFALFFVTTVVLASRNIINYFCKHKKCLNNYKEVQKEIPNGQEMPHGKDNSIL